MLIRFVRLVRSRFAPLQRTHTAGPQHVNIVFPPLAHPSPSLAATPSPNSVMYTVASIPSPPRKHSCRKPALTPRPQKGLVGTAGHEKARYNLV